MAVSKVIYGGETLVDLTSDTVTANDLAEGVTATAADGTQITGLLPKVEIDTALSTTSTNPVQNKVINAALDAKADTDDILVTVGDYTAITGRENLVVIDPDGEDAYISEVDIVKSYADKAAESASSAKGYNDNITTMISTVTSKVDSAVSTASTANSNSTAALSTATTAQSTAESAQTTASSAETKAESALEKVDTQVLVDMFYPVGSVYMTTSDTLPVFMSYGTWEEIASDRVLQGASSSHKAGSTVAAGLPTLPEIELLYRQDSTSSGVYDSTYGHNGKTGSSYSNTSGTDEYMQSCKTDGKTLAPFGAVYYSSTIYGANATVQPPAYIVHIYKRTA